MPITPASPVELEGLVVDLDKPVGYVPTAKRHEPVLTTFGRMAGLVVALWLIVAVLAVASVVVFVGVSALLSLV